MSVPLLIAFILTSLAFVAHSIFGDQEIGDLEPNSTDSGPTTLRLRWTMARCGWHWISVDLLLAAIGMGLVLFSDILSHENYLLGILSLYFLAYAVIWLLTILISKSFPNNILQLGQWLLLLLISGLVYMAI